MKCQHRSHGAAKPMSYKGMTLCEKHLRNDWRNYFIDLTPGYKEVA